MQSMEKVESIKKLLGHRIGKLSYKSTGLRASRKEVMKIVWDTIGDVESQGFEVSNSEFGLLIREAWRLWDMMPEAQFLQKGGDGEEQRLEQAVEVAANKNTTKGGQNENL